MLGFAETELGNLLDAINIGAGTAEAPAPTTVVDAPPSQTLAERFGIPLFSFSHARQGWWQNRKRAWIDLGIRSELGRGAPMGGAPMPIDRAKANQTKISRSRQAERYPGAKTRQSDCRARRLAAAGRELFTN